jgi:hypothetical protein
VSTPVYVERPDSRRRGQRALNAVRSARSHTARRFGPATGWHAKPDWRLDTFTATRVASALEARGWRAESVVLGQGVTLVDVRDLAVRGMPLVATLRTEEEAAGFLRAHPARRPAGPVMPRGSQP